MLPKKLTYRNLKKKKTNNLIIKKSHENDKKSKLIENENKSMNFFKF